jgi:osmotically-inducible protein OsmY
MYAVPFSPQAAEGVFPRRVSPTRFSAKLPNVTDDASLEADIKRALADSPLFETASERQAITVTVREGVAHVRGYVRTLLAALEVEILVQQIPGVLEVRSHLVDDEFLRRTTLSTLRQDRYFNANEIDADVELGVVRVHGQVSSYEQAARAMFILRHNPAIEHIVCTFTVGTASDGSSATPVFNRPRLELRWNKPQPP